MRRVWLTQARPNKFTWMDELLDHDLDVLSSAEFIVQNAENVSIVSKGVENAVNFVSLQRVVESKVDSIVVKAGLCYV